MDKCPKCGAGEDASDGAFACGARRGANGTVKVSGRCLRRQLAAANEKLSESARLATESAQLADGLARDLAAANERAGRLEEALKDAIEHVAGSHIGHYGYHTAYCDITVRPERLTAWVEALEVPDAL